jgi:hypothetical protein
MIHPARQRLPDPLRRCVQLARQSQQYQISQRQRQGGKTKRPGEPEVIGNETGKGAEPLSGMDEIIRRVSARRKSAAQS